MRRAVQRAECYVTRMLSDIEERMAVPTAKGLARAISQSVGDRVLLPGDRLPPIRTVATQLGLSPTTVSAAWAMLARAGTIATDGRRGTVIATRKTVGPSRYRRALDVDSPFTVDLSTGTPDPALLPDLRPALRRVERSFSPSTYLDDPVLPELAEMLRADWPFSAECLTVVDGAMDALQLIVSTHLRFGDRVAIEEPSFPPLLDLVDAAGLVALPVGLDDDGPRPADVRSAVDAGVRMLFLQPRAQNPTGASLTNRRVAELARIVRTADLVVIEDDAAGAVASTPVLSLGRTLPERTLHIRSYSKSHGPDLRLAALGGPKSLVDPIVDRRFLGQGWTSRLLQGILVDLLTHTPSVRAVEHARHTYARRRAALVEALAAQGVPVGGKDGLNVWVPVQDESSALLRLATRGIGVAAGGPFTTRSESGGHLRVTAGMVRRDHPQIAHDIAEASRGGAWASPR